MAATWMQYKLSLMNKINASGEKTPDDSIEFSAYFLRTKLRLTLYGILRVL